MDVGTMLTAGAGVIGVVVWLVRLEGRVNLQAQLHQDLKADVTYIRERIDAALSGRK